MENDIINLINIKDENLIVSNIEVIQDNKKIRLI